MLRVNHLSGFGKKPPVIGGGGGGYAPVTWTDLVNVTESPTGTLTKTDGDGWTAGAFSVEGIAGDGGVRWTIDNQNHNIAFGVSETNSSAHFNTIDFAFVIADVNTLRIYEDGSYIGDFANPANGDVLEVVRSGTSLLYKVNGSTVRTTSTSSSTTLHADVTIFTSGGVINDVEIET